MSTVYVSDDHRFTIERHKGAYIVSELGDDVASFNTLSQAKGWIGKRSTVGARSEFVSKEKGPAAKYLFSGKDYKKG